ncbi:transcriptional regulator SutA [Stutzerimonas tarimensis]|uniref:Transcriptional regulator SutA n=1 Tax=Stutzerimonas tarimensis TaxID=1507735 RepID=A0ABV7T790_9GAMM
MSDEELEQDDLEVTEEDDGEELNAAPEEAEDSEEEQDSAERTTPKKKAKAVEVEELPSLEAKRRERDELERAMAEFLARGGQVQEIEPNVVSDPPKKPDSKYGSRPI